MTASPEAKLGRQILLLSFAAFAAGASLRIADPLLPQLATDFSITTGVAAHAISIFALAYGVFQLMYGSLGDRYGKFLVVALAALASTASSIASALAGSFHVLMVFRFIAGATAAAIIPLSIAWIADSVSYERRQQTLAYFMSGQILGLISGQVLGGVFADLSGWRGAMLCMAALFFAAASLLTVELRRCPELRPQTAPSGTTTGNGQVSQLLTGTLDMLRNSWSRTILLAVLLEGAFLFCSFSFIPAYLHQRFGLTLTLSGSAVAIFGVGGLCYTIFSRRLIRRMGERGLAIGGGGLLGVAFLMLALGNHWGWVIPATGCAGFGFYMLHTTLQVNATQMAPHTRGLAVSLFVTVFFVGQSLGIGIASMFIDRFGMPLIFALSAAMLTLTGVFFARQLGSARTSAPHAGR